MLIDTSAAARTPTDKDMHNFCKYMQDKLNEDSIVVEVGAYVGTNALLMRGYFTNIHCVDAWQMGYDSNDSASKQDMSLVEKAFDENVAGTDIVKHKGLSLDVANEFEDGSIDVIYIDATHTYEGVKGDIEAWLPKLKPNGFMAGHDYETKNEGWDNGGLKRAIHELLGVPTILFGTNWIIPQNP